MAAGGHFERNIQNKKLRIDEMAKTAIESDFQSSKMAAGGHFVKKLKNKSCALI